MVPRVRAHFQNSQHVSKGLTLILVQLAQSSGRSSVDHFPASMLRLPTCCCSELFYPSRSILNSPMLRYTVSAVGLRPSIGQLLGLPMRWHFVPLRFCFWLLTSCLQDPIFSGVPLVVLAFNG